MRPIAKLTDATLIDTVMAYCAMHGVGVESLAKLSFGEVSLRLADMCDRHPQWVHASKVLRDRVGLCHEECHIQRVQLIIQQWEADGRPGAVPTAENVIPFPTNNTKH